MTQTAGRQIEIGLAIEATPGTALAPTKWIPWDSFSFQGIADKTTLQSARGIRNKTSNSKITKLYGKGSLEFSPTPETIPYFLSLFMGSVSSGAHAGETTVYDHTFLTQNTNASMKTATLTQKEGAIVTEQTSNVVCDSFELKLGKDLASLKVDLVGNFPQTTTGTPSYARETLFTINDLHAYMGDSVAAALGTVATTTLTTTNTPVAGAKFTIGRFTYTAVAALTGIPFEVLIGLTASTFLDNLKAAINGAAGEGSTYGYGTPIHPQVIATTKLAASLVINARATGTAGNAIATTTTGTPNATFTSTVMASGTGTEFEIDEVTLNGNNNVLVDDAFRSGNGGYPKAGGFVAGDLEIKGSYTTQYTDGVEVAKYKQNTLKSLVLVINGAAVGTVPTQEQIILKLGKMILTKEPLEFTIGGLTMIKQEFEIQYDATDKEFGAVVTNLVAGTDY